MRGWIQVVQCMQASSAIWLYYWWHNYNTDQNNDEQDVRCFMQNCIASYRHITTHHTNMIHAVKHVPSPLPTFATAFLQIALYCSLVMRLAW